MQKSKNISLQCEKSIQYLQKLGHNILRGPEV